MSKQLIAIDPDQLDALTKEVSLLRQLIERATIVPAPDWVSVPEFAKAQGVTDATVRRWIREGQIEARGSGKARQVFARDGVGI